MTIQDKETATLWDKLISYNIATYDELCLVTDINGYNVETLNDVIYSRTGYRNITQLEEEI